MIPLLLPTQSVYLPGQAVRVEASHPGDLVVTHLGETVREVPCERPGLVDLGELPVGEFTAPASAGTASPSPRPARRALSRCARRRRTDCVTVLSRPSARERTSRPWPVLRAACT